MAENNRAPMFGKRKQKNVHAFCWSRHGWLHTRSPFHDHRSLLHHFCFLVLRNQVFRSNECTRLQKTFISSLRWDKAKPLLTDRASPSLWSPGSRSIEAMSFTKQRFLHCSHGGMIERRMVLPRRNLVLSFFPKPLKVNRAVALKMRRR